MPAGWPVAEVILKVHCTTALKTAVDLLAPSFEETQKIGLSLCFGPSGFIAKQVADADPADVVIVTGPGINDLVAQRRVLAGTRANLARSRIGMAVLKGAAFPDISCEEGFRQAMLAARSIAMSHPASGAQSGAHLVKVFEQLEISGLMRAKSIYGPGGPAGLTGNFVLRGEADVALQQISELMAVPGVDVVGPIPEALQLETVFSAGVATESLHPKEAQSFISHLRTSNAESILKMCGLEPAFE